MVGAHLTGCPLNWQLTSLNATFASATKTAPRYKLFFIDRKAQSLPSVPGLLRGGGGGGDGAGSIEVEVWNVPTANVGAFMAFVGSPLSIGSVELLDGSTVKGFLVEATATKTAPDITSTFVPFCFAFRFVTRARSLTVCLVVV